MNVSTWLWLDWFQGLPIMGKVAIIAGHILVLLLIMLWETYKSQKHEADKSPSAMTCSIEPAEKLVHSISTYPQKSNLYNANKRVGHLLNMFCNKSLINHLFYYQTNNEGDSPTHQIRWHIGYILNWLKRIVNHSGKEPSWLLP